MVLFLALVWFNMARQTDEWTTGRTGRRQQLVFDTDLRTRASITDVSTVPKSGTHPHTKKKCHPLDTGFGSQRLFHSPPPKFVLPVRIILITVLITISLLVCLKNASIPTS
jgi:hypothetical protein